MKIVFVTLLLPTLCFGLKCIKCGSVDSDTIAPECNDPISSSLISVECPPDQKFCYTTDGTLDGKPRLLRDCYDKSQHPYGKLGIPPTTDCQSSGGIPYEGKQLEGYLCFCDTDGCNNKRRGTHGGSQGGGNKKSAGEVKTFSFSAFAGCCLSLLLLFSN